MTLIKATALLMAMALASHAVAAGIGNGDFELPANAPAFPPWLEAGGAAIANGGSGGTLHRAQLGPSNGINVNTGFITTVFQPFDCGLPADGNCWIKFDYKFNPAQNGVFLVMVDGAVGKKVVYPAASANAFKRVQVKYPRCGNLTIAFAIYEPAPAQQIAGSLDVDLVADKCNETWADVEELTLEDMGVPPTADQLALLVAMGALPSVPTVSEWGLIAATCLIGCAGAICIARTRRREALVPVHA